MKKFLENPANRAVVFQMCLIGAALGTLAFMAQTFTAAPRANPCSGAVKVLQPYLGC